MLGGKGECGQIVVETMFNARSQHFDRDGARTVRSRHFGAMDLRDRGGGHRRTKAQKY
jgi:hypothetical protein